MLRHPDSLRTSILQAYQEGERSRRVLAQRFGVSPSFVHYLLRPLCMCGQDVPHPGGRPALLDSAQRDLLRVLATTDSAASLPQLQMRLVEAGGPLVSKSTLCRALRQLGLVRCGNRWLTSQSLCLRPFAAHRPLYRTPFPSAWSQLRHHPWCLPQRGPSGWSTGARMTRI